MRVNVKTRESANSATLNRINTKTAEDDVTRRIRYRVCKQSYGCAYKVAPKTILRGTIRQTRSAYGMISDSGTILVKILEE